MLGTTTQLLAALALLTLAIPVALLVLQRLRPHTWRALRNLFASGIRPNQDDLLIGFPLFIVFCGILMGWMLLFVGVVRQGMLH